MGKLAEASAKKKKKAAAAKAHAAAAAAAADAAAASAAAAFSTDAASPAAAAAIDAPAVNPPDVTTRVTRGGGGQRAAAAPDVTTRVTQGGGGQRAAAAVASKAAAMPAAVLEEEVDWAAIRETLRTKAAAAWSAASAAAAISTDAASPIADDAIAAAGTAVSGSVAKRKSGGKRQIEDPPVIRRSPRSPQKLAISTAVPPPAANFSVEAVAAVQPTASAKASASVQGVPAASLLSISFFVLFVLSELIYTNSYLLRSVCIPSFLYHFVYSNWYDAQEDVSVKAVAAIQPSGASAEAGTCLQEFPIFEPPSVVSIFLCMICFILIDLY